MTTQTPSPQTGFANVFSFYIDATVTDVYGNTLADQPIQWSVSGASGGFAEDTLYEFIPNGAGTGVSLNGLNPEDSVPYQGATYLWPSLSTLTPTTGYNVVSFVPEITTTTIPPQVTVTMSSPGAQKSAQIVVNIDNVQPGGSGSTAYETNITPNPQPGYTPEIYADTEGIIPAGIQGTVANVPAVVEVFGLNSDLETYSPLASGGTYYVPNGTSPATAVQVSSVTVTMSTLGGGNQRLAIETQTIAQLTGSAADFYPSYLTNGPETLAFAVIVTLQNGQVIPLATSFVYVTSSTPQIRTLGNNGLFGVGGCPMTPGAGTGFSVSNPSDSPIYVEIDQSPQDAIGALVPSANQSINGSTALANPTKIRIEWLVEPQSTGEWEINTSIPLRRSNANGVRVRAKREFRYVGRHGACGCGRRRRRRGRARKCRLPTDHRSLHRRDERQRKWWFRELIMCRAYVF